MIKISTNNQKDGTIFSYIILQNEDKDEVFPKILRLVKNVFSDVQFRVHDKYEGYYIAKVNNFDIEFVNDDCFGITINSQTKEGNDTLIEILDQIKEKLE